MIHLVYTCRLIGIFSVTYMLPNAQLFANGCLYLKSKSCWWLKCSSLANAKSNFMQKLEIYCGKEESLNAREEALIGYKVIMGC